MKKRNVRKTVLGFAGAAAGWAAPAAMATDYTLNKPAGSYTWSDATNTSVWIDGLGNTSNATTFPGSAASDTANTENTTSPVGGNLTLNIPTALMNPLATLTMGTTGGTFTTLITSSGTGNLPIAAAGTINSAGAAGAVNQIGAAFLMPAGNVTLGAASTNALTFTNAGTFTNGLGGTSAAPRVFQNAGTLAVTLNGPVFLSPDATASNLRLMTTTANPTGTVVVGGVVANSATAGASASGLSIQGNVTLTGANTYTGGTTLGANSGGVATVTIGTDTAFGTGTVTATGASGNTQVIQGLTGGGTRTLANNVTLSRNLGVAGSESIVLNGTLTLSNSASISNAITAAGKTLSLGTTPNGGTGNLFTDNAAGGGRNVTFTGGGTNTIVNGVIDDTSNATPGTAGGVNMTGTGTVTFLGTMAYNNTTTVTSGTLSLGNGGTAGGLNAAGPTPVVLAGGTLTVNHSDAVDFNHGMSGTATTGGFRQAGTGTTTLSATNFQAAPVTVAAGKLLINGPALGTVTVAGGVNGTASAIVTGTDTTNLRVGQPITGTGVATGAVIRSIDSATQFTMSANATTTGGTSITSTPGTGTGTGSVTVLSGGTVGGTGVIGGSLNSAGVAGNVAANGVVAPGLSIGTLTITGTGTSTLSGTLAVEYNGAAGGTIDLLNAGSSPVNISSANSAVNFSQLGSALPAAGGPSLVFVKYASLTGTFGTVQNLPAGYGINYAYNDGSSTNNIALVPIPEPASLGLTGLAAFGLLARRSGRRRRTPA